MTAFSVEAAGFKISGNYEGGNVSHATCAGAVLHNITSSCTDQNKWPGLCKALAEQLKDKTHLIFGIGPVNYSRKARGYVMNHLTTAHFFEWLIENKYGMVVESPLMINGAHSMQQPSLVQGWMWITPGTLAAGFVVPDTGSIHGRENITHSLTDNDTLNETIVTFDDLVDPWIAKAERFTKAREVWNARRPKLAEERKAKKLKRRGELWTLSTV